MAIKWTIQGCLIYAAMAAYGLAFILTMWQRRKTGTLAYRVGFVIAAVAFVYRWVHVGHIPMQNLFEVFLAMGMLIYILSAFSRRRLRVGVEPADMLIGIALLFPAGFVFGAAPQQLPPALQCFLFAPHVAVYVISYVIMAKATVQAVYQLSCPAGPRDAHLIDYEQATYRMVCLGFPLMTLGLILGSWWGHLAWADYWGWDPKELWSLASWLVYLAYFHFRYMYGRRYARLNSIWAIAGMTAIIITLLWVNLSKLFGGLHNYAS